MGVVSILPAGLGPANTIRDESRRAFLADNLLIKLPKWAGGYWPPPGTDKSFTRHPQGPTGIRVTSTGGTASTYPASRSQTSCLKSHSGYKEFRHPAVGDLQLSFNALTLPAEPGLTLTALSAEPNTPSESGMQRLIELVHGTATPVSAPAGVSR